MCVITLLAVPPGQHPTRITPRAKSAGNLNATAKIHATTGIIVNCAMQPMITSLGLLIISLKSDVVIVVPIPNIANPKNIAV